MYLRAGKTGPTLACWQTVCPMRVSSRPVYKSIPRLKLPRKKLASSWLKLHSAVVELRTAEQFAAVLETAAGRHKSEAQQT